MPSRRYGRTRTLLLALSLLAACGTGPPDPQAGERLFRGETPIAGYEGQPCIRCHPTAPGEAAAVLGPNLSNIGLRAGRTVPNQSSEAYLRTAILDPDAYLAGNFQDGIMDRRYGQLLSGQQVEDLIAYMQTLQSGADE
jgi:cytochrome c1